MNSERLMSAKYWHDKANDYLTEIIFACMRCPEDIAKLAEQKLLESECLLAERFFDWAYYTAGYCIELLLKARICTTLGIDDFFDHGNPSKKKLKNEGFINKAYKVHDLEQLIVLSGIYRKFEEEVKENLAFREDWSVVSQWNENCRYDCSRSETDVKDFVTSIKQVMQWIQKQ